MSTKTRAFVEEFHTTYRAAINTEPTLSTGFEELRLKLIAEEVAETLTAIMLNDNTEFVDGLGDLDYVIEGAAITFGLVLDDITDQVDEFLFLDSDQLIGKLVLGVLELGKRINSRLYGGIEVESVLVQRQLERLKAIVWTIATASDVPLEKIIEVIHESNMSKLGEDGQPIFREDGKVLKGPNFFTPTEKIKEIMEQHENERAKNLYA